MRFVCIAVCGRRGSGKDSIAEILCKHYQFENYKFARPLKTAVASLFNLDPDHVDGSLKDVVHPRWGITPRLMMQWFGTEVMQHGLNSIAPGTGRTFWSNHLKLELQSRVSTTNVVVSDLRFPHELQMLRELFQDRLITLRVVRELSVDEGIGEIGEAGEVRSFGDSHESEAGAMNLAVDAEILNTGTLAELETAIHAIIKKKALSRHRE